MTNDELIEVFRRMLRTTDLSSEEAREIISIVLNHVRGADKSARRPENAQQR